MPTTTLAQLIYTGDARLGMCVCVMYDIIEREKAKHSLGGPSGVFLEKTMYFDLLGARGVGRVYRYIYVCKSTEICDETLKKLLKICFRAHLRGQVFLVVRCIYKRNLLLYNAYRMVYFFQNHFLLFKKMSKKALLFKPQPLSPEMIYSKFQKRN